MSNKIKLAKMTRRIIRKKTNDISRKMIEDLLNRSFWYRFRIAVNIIFKKIIFNVK